VREHLSSSDINHLQRFFRNTAFRFETLDGYNVPQETEFLERFEAGESHSIAEFEYFAAWLTLVQQATQEGRRIERVRVISEPATGYQRWVMWIGQFAELAGEVIKYITRDDALRAELPVESGDWWLLDSERLLRLEFDESGKPMGGELIHDAGIVLPYCAWRDVAVHHSIRLDDSRGPIRADGP